MRNKTKSFIYGVIAILIGLAFIPLALEIILRFLPVFSGMPVNREASIYSFIPNTTIQRSMHWNLTGARKRQVNNVGFISDQQYEKTSNRSNQKPLIAIIGDSYIEGMHVDYSQTVEANMVKSCGNDARIYSFGAQFAPLSQYLSWASYVGEEYSPKLMVINIVGNDFDESLLSYQLNANNGGVPGMHFFDFSKTPPELVALSFKSEGLVTRMLRHSALAQYLVRNVGVVNIWREYQNRHLTNQSQLIQSADPKPLINQKAGLEQGAVKSHASSDVANNHHQTGKSLSEFVGNAKRFYSPEKLAQSQKAVDLFLDLLPKLAKLPAQSIVLSVDAERPQIYTDAGKKDLDSFFSVMRMYFMKQARTKGFVVVDLRPAMIEQFENTGEHFEFVNDNHWNAAGHQLLANQLLQVPPISALCVGQNKLH